MDLDFFKAVRGLGAEAHSQVLEIEGRLFFALPAPPGSGGEGFRFEIDSLTFDVLAAEFYRHAALHRVLEGAEILG